MRNKNKLMSLIKTLKNILSKAVDRHRHTNQKLITGESWKKAETWDEVINYLTQTINAYRNKTENELANTLISLSKYIDLYSLDGELKSEKKKILGLVEQIVNSAILIINKTPPPYIKRQFCGKHEDGACELRKVSTRILNPPRGLLPQIAASFRAPYIFKVKILRNFHLKIIRVIGTNNSPYGSYWMIGYKPTSKKKWRSRFAVLSIWNTGTHYVELKIRKDITCWLGLAASQQIPIHPCILYGGWYQLWIDPIIINKLKNNILLPPSATGW